MDREIEAPSGSGRAVRSIPLLLLATLYVALAAISWRRTGDPLVDWGRELYTAWRLSTGAVLYADVDSLFGPLSPYLNGFLFRVFGVSATTLLFANLALVALTAGLLYRLFHQLGDRTTATLVSAAFLVGFAFSHLTLSGALNFVSPYSHQATHGIVLSVLMVAAFQAYLRCGKRSRAVWAGVALGAVGLTKPEIAVAAAGGLAVGWGLVGVTRAVQHWRRHLASCLAGIAVVPSAFLLLFLLQGRPLVEAARAIVTAWTRLAAARAWASPYYRWSFRGEGTASSLAAMGLTLVVALAAVGLLVALDRAVAHRRGKASLRVALPLLLALALLWGGSAIPWLTFARPLPVIALGAAVWFSRSSLQRTASPLALRRTILLAVWASFAFLLLGRILLFSRLEHYGFYLGMPAAVLTVHVAVHETPRILARRAGAGRLTRAGLTAVLLVFGFFLTVRSLGHYARKTRPLGEGGDLLLTFPAEIDPRPEEISRALPLLRQLHQPGTTLAVFPEGAMLNYLERWPAPTPHTSFMPVELQLYGEQPVLTALQRHPPDVVVITGRDLSEYGEDRFGEPPGSGQRLHAWLEKEYVPVATLAPRGAGRLAQGLEIRRHIEKSAPQR